MMFTRIFKPNCQRRFLRKKITVAFFSIAFIGFLFVCYQVLSVQRLSEEIGRSGYHHHRTRGKIDMIHNYDSYPNDILVHDKSTNKDKYHPQMAAPEQSDSQRMKYLQEINDNKEVHPNPVKSMLKIRGIREKDLVSYIPDENGMFRCIKSGIKIPFKNVNDNYCDCIEDGSDEPGTSACANAKFYCDNQSEGKKAVIPSSRVNDGICDCCDGSDEWAGLEVPNRLDDAVQKKLGRFQTPCPYICTL